MEEHEVPHEGIDARIGEIVAGRGDEQDFVPLFVEGRINADTRDRLDIVAQEFDDFLHCMGLDAEMVAGAVALDTGSMIQLEARPSSSSISRTRTVSSAVSMP